jgi:hypothetical protein
VQDLFDQMTALLPIALLASDPERIHISFELDIDAV